MQYKTGDLNLAASLLTLGHRFIGVEHDGTVKRFCFDVEEEFEIDVRNFFNNRLKLPARSLLDNAQVLRTSDQSSVYATPR